MDETSLLQQVLRVAAHKTKYPAAMRQLALIAAAPSYQHVRQPD
jgi:hypothetical protein